MGKAKAYHLIEDYPNKLYYTIAEVAKDLSVEQSALRFWENEFDTLKPKRDPKGRRQYTKKDVITVRQIYDLVKVEGLSLEGAKSKLKNKKGEVEKTSELRARLQNLKEQIKTLSDLLTLPSEVAAEEGTSSIELVGYENNAAEEENNPIVFDTPDTEKNDEKEADKEEDITAPEEKKEEIDNTETQDKSEEEETESRNKGETESEEKKEVKKETEEDKGQEATDEDTTKSSEEGIQEESTGEEVQEEPKVHVFQQNSLFGDEFVERTTYTPKKKNEEKNEEETKENKKEEEDSRQLSLFD